MDVKNRESLQDEPPRFYRVRRGWHRRQIVRCSGSGHRGGRHPSAHDRLELFGRPSGGTFQSSVSRIGYSDADIAGRKFVTELMQKAGAKVRVGAAGNIFAERPGIEPSLPPVLFGCHIDSVPNGGNFDGDLDSLASVHILRVLHESRIQTRRPLTAVVWACEEATFAGASLNGSRAVAGKMLPDELNQVSGGLVKSEAIRRIGGDPSRIENARILSGSYHAYLELHIEQGGTLARDGVPVGVVDGIVANDSYDVIVSGFANHAGTTPMQDRQDALVAAAKLTLAVHETVTSETGAQVGTVGHLDVSFERRQCYSWRGEDEHRIERFILGKTRTIGGEN